MKVVLAAVAAVLVVGHGTRSNKTAETKCLPPPLTHEYELYSPKPAVVASGGGEVELREDIPVKATSVWLVRKDGLGKVLLHLHVAECQLRAAVGQQLLRHGVTYLV